MTKHKRLLFIGSIVIIIAISSIAIILFINHDSDGHTKKLEEPPISSKNTQHDKKHQKTSDNSQSDNSQKEIESKGNDSMDKENQNIENNVSDIPNTVEENIHQNIDNKGGASNKSSSDSSSSTNNSVASCTPKKFYTVFRADFDNIETCISIGNQYKSIYGYYGFTCDYQTDDCGVMYYMLSMFDTNGIEYGYNAIPKP